MILATVVRVEICPDGKTFDIGVSFVGIDEDDEAGVDKYIANRK